MTLPMWEKPFFDVKFSIVVDHPQHKLWLTRLLKTEELPISEFLAASKKNLLSKRHASERTEGGGADKESKSWDVS